MKKNIKLMLTQPQKVKIKSFFKKETFLKNIVAYLFSFNLTKLAIIYGSDKWGGHSYTLHYQRHFKKFRFKKINLLEIGVGGYENPFSGGQSLRMWKKFFPFAKIFSLDIFDKSFLQENRIKIYRGSQIDNDFLQKVCDDAGLFDIIIDDGSHINEHVIKSFEFLFPKLKIGGIYVVEDTQTSYWEDYGGDSNDFNKEGTIYHYFKSLIDSLNHEEFMIGNYKKSYYDKHIISMHFYHNMIFIYKGINNESSNYLKNNKRSNG
jgi:hypothetical protein